MPTYRLASELATVAAVKALWAVRTPRLTATPQPRAGAADSAAGAATQLPRLLLQLRDTDVPSLYTWHIKGPNGYAPVAAGTERLFVPAAAGTYTIAVRQDNLGLPATGRTRYGSRTFQATVVVAPNCEASVLTAVLGRLPAPRRPAGTKAGTAPAAQSPTTLGRVAALAGRSGSRSAKAAVPVRRISGQSVSPQALVKLAATGCQPMSWQ